MCLRLSAQLVERSRTTDHCNHSFFLVFHCTQLLKTRIRSEQIDLSLYNGVFKISDVELNCDVRSRDHQLGFFHFCTMKLYQPRKMETDIKTRKNSLWATRISPLRPPFYLLFQVLNELTKELNLPFKFVRGVIRQVGGTVPYSVRF